MQDPRYDASIYATPFSALADQKRVWVGAPSSALEGLGLSSLTRYSSDSKARLKKALKLMLVLRTPLALDGRRRSEGRGGGDQDWQESRPWLGHDEA